MRQAPMAVQNTIQPTITNDAAKVDSGISGFAAGPPPGPPPLNGVGETPGLDVGHGHTHDPPLDVEQVRDDVAAEDGRQDQLQHDEEDHWDRPLSDQRGQAEATMNPMVASSPIHSPTSTISVVEGTKKFEW